MSVTTDRAAVVKAALERALHPDEIVAHEGAREVRICAGTACHASGRPAVTAAFRDQLAEQGLADTVRVVETGCHGFCGQGPIVIVEPRGLIYGGVQAGDVAAIIAASVSSDGALEERLFRHLGTGEPVLRRPDLPFYAAQRRRVLALSGVIDPRSIDDYLACGGYAALARVLAGESQLAARAVAVSGLVQAESAVAGLVAGETDRVGLVVCDVGAREYATPVERSIVESDPHAVIEGMAIVACVVGASEGLLSLHAPDRRVEEHFDRAITTARQRGLLGHHLLASDVSFDVRVETSFGEETRVALASSGGGELRQSSESTRCHEGLPGGLPVASGCVENYAIVPWLIAHGDAERAVAATTPGNWIVSLAGAVACGGIAEVPSRMTLRELIFDLGGGPRPGRRVRAVGLDGVGGCCLPADGLDRPLGGEGAGSSGRAIGLGAVMVMDDTACIVDLARGFAELAQGLSCGACAPCRLGTKRLQETLGRVCEGGGRKGDVELVRELAEGIADGARCERGRSACRALLSTIEYFRDDYDAHIVEKRCPAGRCKALS